MLKKIKYVFLCFFIVFSIFIFKQDIKAESSSKIKIYLFYGDGCPHCAKEKELLKKIEKKHSEELEFVCYEIWNYDENKKLMNVMKEKLGVTKEGVPFIIIGEKSFTGYDENVGTRIESAIEDLVNNGEFKDIVVETINDEQNDLNISKLHSNALSNKNIFSQMISKIKDLEDYVGIFGLSLPFPIFSAVLFILILIILVIPRKRGKV